MNLGKKKEFIKLRSFFVCFFPMQKLLVSGSFLVCLFLKDFFFFFTVSSLQFSSVAQSCPTLCDPMNRSTPGLPVHHQLREFTQTHVHGVSDAIQSSHPLSSPSPPAPIYFIRSSLYLLISYPYFVPPPFPLPTGNHSETKCPKGETDIINCNVLA